jgi:hypothetical protein
MRTTWTARRPHNTFAVLLIAGLGQVASGAGAPGREQTSPPVQSAIAAPTSPESLLWIEMRNLTLHLDNRATIRVRRLRGEMTSAIRGTIPSLDDRTSYSIRVTSGTVGLTGEDLTTLLNTFVFAYKGAPLRDLRARPAGGEVSLTGIMHKGVDLRFDISSALSMTPEGLIRLRPTRVSILGIDGQKLLNALGLHLDDLLDLKGSQGASVNGDDILLDPARILPPPAVTGRVLATRVVGSEVVIDFETLPTDSVFGTYVRADSTTPNFVYFRGARLRFGKLTMDDTDLMIADADPSNPFDLNLEEYAKQLTAGTSRTLTNHGLRVEMPDFGTLGKSGPP